MLELPADSSRLCTNDWVKFEEDFQLARAVRQSLCDNSRRSGDPIKTVYFNFRFVACLPKARGGE